MRKRQKSKTAYLILLLLVPGLFASAQKTFKYQALLNRIDSSGFYRINLFPDVVSKSRDDLSDIRLMEASGKFAPYVSDGNLPQVEKEKFIVFPQIPIPLPTDTGTSLIVENTDKKPISTLWVKLKNTAVARLVNLSGSDDQKTWYAIEENIPLQQAVLNSDGTYLQSMSFPASSYHYLKLLVNDRNKLPVKFLEAGEYISANAPKVIYWPVSWGSFTRKELNKATWLTVQLKDSYLVNRLQFSVNGPKFYERELSIYQVDSNGRHLLTTAELSSNSKNDIFLSAKTNRLELRIDNGDNLPLSIDDIKVYQAGKYIVGYLEKGKNYRLLTGDEHAETPQYDLKFFTDSIRNIRQTGMGTLVNNLAYVSPVVVARHETNIIIWVAIVIAVLLLSLLTWKMIGEVNKKAAK